MKEPTNRINHILKIIKTYPISIFGWTSFIVSSTVLGIAKHTGLSNFYTFHDPFYIIIYVIFAISSVLILASPFTDLDR